jgi:hypothetical protein
MKILHVTQMLSLLEQVLQPTGCVKGSARWVLTSMMFANRARQQEDCIITPTGTFERIAARLYLMLDRMLCRLSGLQLNRISSSWMPDNLPSRLNQLQASVMNLHWVNAGFMWIETLPRFQQPTAWTLHDMRPFAGGEHYIGETVRYRDRGARR